MTLAGGTEPFSPLSALAEARRVEEVGRLARGGHLSELVAMLGDPSWPVRRAVVAALASAGASAVAPLCEELRHARSNEVRIAATVDALSAVTGDADDTIAAMAATSAAPVLADIAQILGRRRTTSALATVVALSRHADDNVAAAAIEALGRIGGRAAVDSLVEAVESARFFRTFPAIDVLGRSGDPRAVAPLSALLELPPYAAQAARALGRTGDVAAVEPLMRLVGRSGSAVVRLAASAMAELHARHRERFGGASRVESEIRAAGNGGALVRQLLRAVAEGEDPERAAVCFLLGVLGDPSATPALTALLAAAPILAEAASSALRAFGPSVEEDILRGLRSGERSHRRVLLPFVSGGRAARDVAACLTDDDPDVKVLACQALGRIGEVAVVGALFPLLSEANARVAYAALAAIQSLGSAQTQRLAIEAARSNDVRVRRAALRILSYFGAPDALEVLLAALHDPDERVRETALQGLPFMDDPKAREALLAAANHVAERTRAVAMRSLGQCLGDLRASACLLKGLSDSDAWVRYYACQALGKLAFEPAAAAVVGLLGDKAGHVRVAAVEALASLQSDSAAEALKLAAADADQDIQRAALLGLGVAKRDDSFPLILAALGSAEAATRLVALSALSGFRCPQVLEAFRAAAADPAEIVRTAAISFLAAAPGVDATQVLVELLRDSPSCEHVATALSLHVEGRTAGLMAALEKADDEVAYAITSALVRLRRPAATLALIDAMTMPHLAARKAAAGALAAVASREALDALRQAAARDPDGEVRRICTLLLAR